MDAIEADARGVRVGAVTGVTEGRCDDSDGEHTATGSHDLPGLIMFRPSVEDEGILVDTLEASDGQARRIRAGIARGGEDDADACAIMPADRVCGIGQASARGRVAEREEVSVEERQDDLHLGIAEAAVELDHPQAVRRQHQPGIEDAAIGDATGGERAYRGVERITWPGRFYRSDIAASEGRVHATA